MLTRRTPLRRARIRPSASHVQSTRGAAGAAVTDRTAPPKPQKGTRQREKARAARAKAKAWRAVCAAVEARDGGCRVCGYPFASTNFPLMRMDFHHIVFRSQGGKDETSNVVLLCRTCHDKVHARTLYLSGDADGKLVVLEDKGRYYSGVML